MTAAEPIPAGSWWDVCAIDPVLGVGRRLERLFAATREAAENTARARHGESVLVSLAAGKPRRNPREWFARDLGNTNPRGSR